MKKNYLGAFEELIMLTIGVLDNHAYGVSIKEEMYAKTKKKRLERKGMIESWEGGATQERGGRKKRYYKLTASGLEILKAAHEIRNQMFELIVVRPT
jgi:predicted transcriptional regulator